MRTLALIVRQARYDLRAFWRNPAAAFFTFVFPIMFLVIFNLVFGDQDIEIPGGEVSTSTFYVPAIVALSVISACYTNVAMAISFQRDEGVLKRIRGTPLPPIAFLMGRIIQATVISLLLVLVVLALGVVVYDVDLPTDKMPAFILTLILGAMTFCALGLAVSAFVPNADAATAIINGSILPLLFISNVFIPTANSPQWLNDFASLFPISHFATALQRAFSPYETGSGFDLKGLAVMAAWGLGAVLVASRFFRWETRR